MMPPTRLLVIILGPATGIQRAFLPVVLGTTGASTRSHSGVELI
jgi:hypothetical protein